MSSGQGPRTHLQCRCERQQSERHYRERHIKSKGNSRMRKSIASVYHRFAGACAVCQSLRVLLIPSRETDPVRIIRAAQIQLQRWRRMDCVARIEPTRPVGPGDDLQGQRLRVKLIIEVRDAMLRRTFNRSKRKTNEASMPLRSLRLR